MHKKFTFIVLISVAGYLPAVAQTIADQSSDNQGMFTLNSGNMSMIIDGNTGSRIVSLKLDGAEILGSKNLNARYYGSSLWLSPEAIWRAMGVIDVSPYKLGYFNDTDLLLKSNNDSINGFEVSKKFHKNLADTSVTIEYTITSTSTKVQEVAPWEVTRVPTGGLVFFPKGSPGDIPVPNRRMPSLSVKDSTGIIWYPHDPSSSSAKKLFMDAGEGWVAYVRNRIVFIKKFPVIKSDQAAPGEKNVELYINRENTYMELENQGLYQKLAPGESLIYKVKWYARRLPAGLNAETGNRALISYVRSLVDSGDY